jgi:hypothetical protein
MPETFPIHSIPLMLEGTLELVKHLYARRNEPFLVELADGTVQTTGRWLTVNAFLWRPLVKRGYRVEKRHSWFSGLLTKEVLANIQTEIYNDVIDGNHVSGTHADGALESEILYDIMDTFDHMHRWIATNLGEYHLSISAFEMCDLLDHPLIAPLTKIDLSQEMEVSIAAAEEKLKTQGEKLMEMFKNDGIPNNIIAPFLKLGLLSAQQLPQVFMAVGFRKDASDQIVRYPITESFTSGLKDIKDFAVESLSAKITIYYNRNAMPDSQYDNRKQQILACSVRRLYPGDCGSKVTVGFYVHKGNAKQIVDANIIMDDGRELRLTNNNVSNFIGSTVQLRNPLTCRHTDGICHACGGRLTDFMHPDVVIGIASTVEYMSAASQLVLSAKHFSKTSSITYKVPDQLSNLLIVKQNDIFIQPDVDVSKLKVKIQYSDMDNVNNLKSGDDDDEDGGSSIGEQQFSSINYLTFLDANDVPLTAEIPMVSDGTIPYFSIEMLNYMKDNFRSLQIGDEIIIPLKKFNHANEPLLRCVVESNSMIKFNATLEKFVKTDIRRHTSLQSVLEAFTGIVYKEIKTNIMHLSVVLKSYLVTNEHNYNIPVVEDPNNVMFDSLGSIIPRRSLGQQFAYQELLKYLSDPSTYVLPHPRGLLDTLFYVDA